MSDKRLQLNCSSDVYPEAQTFVFGSGCIGSEPLRALAPSWVQDKAPGRGSGTKLPQERVMGLGTRVR